MKNPKDQLFSTASFLSLFSSAPACYAIINIFSLVNSKLLEAKISVIRNAILYTIPLSLLFVTHMALVMFMAYRVTTRHFNHNKAKTSAFLRRASFSGSSVLIAIDIVCLVLGLLTHYDSAFLFIIHAYAYVALCLYVITSAIITFQGITLSLSSSKKTPTDQLPESADGPSVSKSSEPITSETP